MKATLVPGISAVETLRVDESRAIGFLGDEYRVYSTPCVLRDIEFACRKLADLHLDPGEGNVGTRVNLEHIGAGLIGAELTVQVSLVAVKGRRLTFEAQTHCGGELIARCTHERFVVDLAKSKERLIKKRAELLAKGVIRSGA